MRVGAAASFFGGAVLAALAPGAAAGPALVDETDTDTFVHTGAEQSYFVPAGITEVNVVAYGGTGASLTLPGASAGGRGARVESDLTVTPSTLHYVNVGGNGSGINGGFNGGGRGGTTPANFEGGGGGGATDLRTVPRAVGGTLQSRLVVAAGGGGAGGDGGSCNGNASNTGGAGGNAGSVGTTAGGDLVSARGGGGGAGTASAGGAAGTAGTGGTFGDATAGIAGTLGSGGEGGASPDNDPGGEGGGGGGGLYGGGGGGGGTSGGNCPVEGGGGGGGGSSLGDSVAVAAPAEAPRLTISWSAPRTAIDGPPKRIKTERKRKTVRFSLLSSNPAATFECSLDAKAFKLCEDPYVAELRAGRHTLEAIASDGTNADPTPAKARVRIIRKG